MKDAVNVLFWKVLTQLRCKLNVFLSLRLLLLFVLPFCPVCSSSHTAHCLYQYLNLCRSLPQLVVRRCRRRTWQSWREAQPRSPAACRTMMDQLWSSRIPDGRRSSLTAHAVRICTHICLSRQTQSICILAFALGDIWSQPFIHISSDSPTLTFFLMQASSLCLWSDSTLKSQMTADLIYKMVLLCALASQLLSLF